MGRWSILRKNAKKNVGKAGFDPATFGLDVIIVFYETNALPTAPLSLPIRSPVVKMAI